MLESLKKDISLEKLTINLKLFLTENFIELE